MKSALLATMVLLGCRVSPAEQTPTPTPPAPQPAVADGDAREANSCENTQPLPTVRLDGEWTQLRSWYRLPQVADAPQPLPPEVDRRRYCANPPPRSALAVAAAVAPEILSGVPTAERPSAAAGTPAPLSVESTPPRGRGLSVHARRAGAQTQIKLDPGTRKSMELAVDSAWGWDLEGRFVLAVLARYEDHEFPSVPATAPSAVVVSVDEAPASVTCVVLVRDDGLTRLIPADGKGAGYRISGDWSLLAVRFET